MDFIHYITALVVFLGVSFVVAFTAHMVLMQKARRKEADLSTPER